MKRYFIFILLSFLLLTCVAGICSDSAYISIRWNGPTDKPHHEFVFYKTGGYNPEPHSISYTGSPFVSKIALSEKEFEKMKHILFAEYHNPDSSDKADPLFMSYYIGYFEGSRWLMTNFMNNKADFIKTAIVVKKIFRRTKYEAEVTNRWIVIFERSGIKPE